MDSMREAKMLLPMEKLFLQILEEKKKSIIQRVKHQTDLFDHHLASKCLLEGIPPPPWLFPNHPSLSSTELQKEDIISGLLLPRANLYSSTQFSEKESSVDNAALPTSLCTEVCGEKESVCVDRLSVLPQLCTSGAPCVLNGVMEMDFSVASPQVCWDEGVDNAVLPTSLCTEVCGEKESVCVDRLSVLPQLGASGAPCVLNGVMEMDFSVASPQVCWDEGVENAMLPTSLCTEVCGEKESVCVDRLSVLPQLGASGAPSVLNGVMEMDVSVASPQVCWDEGVDNAVLPTSLCTEVCGEKESVCVDRLSVLPQLGASGAPCVLNMEMDFSVASPQVCWDEGVDNAMLPTSLCTEVCGEKESVCVDRLSVLPQLGASGAPCVLNGVMEMDFSVASPQVCWDEGVLEMSDADHTRSLARIQRSKSRQRALELRSSAKRTKMCPRDASDPGMSGHQTLEPDGVTLQFGSTYGLELINALEASNRICVDEVEKLGECSGKDYCADDFKCKKHDTSIDTSELMRVRSSVPLPNSVKELSDVNNSSCFAMEKNRLTESINRLVLPRTPSIIANETQEARKSNVGDEWSRGNRNDRTTRSSSIQQPNHANDYLSLDSSRRSGKVEEEKTCECRSREDCCDAYCGRIKRSLCSNDQIVSVSKPGSASTSFCTGKEYNFAVDFAGSIRQPHHVHVLLELTKPSVISDLNCEASKTSIDGVECEKMATSSDSRGIVRLDSSRPSSEPPQPLGLAGRESVELQAELASKIDVLPSSIKGESAADLRICDAAVADADVDFDGEVRSGSRPPIGCAMLVKPKLLHFDEEECSFQPSTLLENINQRMSSEDQPSALLHCTDLLDNIVSIDHQEDPNSSTETPVLEDHELASNDKKSLTESSEAFVNNCSFLIDETVIGSVQKNINLSTSQNQLEGMYPMGSWSQHECAKMGDQLTTPLSASPRPIKNLSESLQADNSNIRMSPVEDIQNYKFCSWPQHEHAKLGGQLTTALSASPRPMKKLSWSLQADNSNIRMSPVEDIHVNEKQQIEEGIEFPSHKLQVEQVELSLEERDGCASAAYTPIQEPLGLPSGSSLPIGVSVDDNQVLPCRESGIDLGFSELLTDSGKTMQESIYHEGMNVNLSQFSVSPPQEKSKDLTGTNESMLEFEGFVIGADAEQPHITDFDTLDLSITAIERASLVERLCKSACLHKSLSHFSTTYMNLYQSVPNGLLEGMELRSPLNINDDVSEQLAASSSCLNEEVNCAFRGGSHSECLPFPNVQSPWDIKKPYLSPAGKLWDKITSKSGSSENRASSIPDLPCITEENENIDEVVDTYQNGVGSEAMNSALKREPLADMTESTHPPTSVYEPEKHDDRHSLASVSTELSFTGTCKRTRPKHGNQNSNKRRYVSSQKENQGISLEVNGVKRDTRSLRNRFSKPQLSVKPSLRKEGPSLSTREPKRNNIVSDVTSFVPLLQQKQEAEANKGKRDVKVKALEAAEAAKRREEKKEHEKKMQKEARLVERARIEELEKVRKEEERKRKEEAQKKKDAELAAKKRQREEEERKEKERKKKRVDETGKQQVKNKEKLHAEKEQKVLKFKAAEFKGKYGKQEKRDQVTEENNIQKSEIETTTQALTIDTRKTFISPEEHEALHGCRDTLQEVRYLCNLTESDKLTSNVIHEQSYDISPYKGSDDEEEDDVSNAKFIPSWGSKRNVAVLLASQQQIDPLSIFSPEDFFNITEVLLPRKFRAK